MSRLIIALSIAVLLFAVPVVAAGPCAGGKCPVPIAGVYAPSVDVHVAVGRIVSRRPVRSAVGAIVSRQPVRSVAKAVVSRRPQLLKRVAGAIAFRRPARRVVGAVLRSPWR